MQSTLMWATPGSWPDPPEESYPDPSPFNRSTGAARTNSYFRWTSINRHLDALKQGDIGKLLVDLAKRRKIQFKENEDMPKNTEGMYIYTKGSSRPGHIEHGNMINALLLGHELRHAWQHLCLPAALSSPNSAQGQILLDGWMEADGRAIEFGCTVQTVSAMGGKGDTYADSLVACLDPYEKEILEYSYNKLNEINASPKKLKQAMRQVFDRWIAYGPTVPDCYREQSEKALEKCSTSRLREKFYNIALAGRHPMPCFTKAEMDPEYPQKLAEALGSLGGTGAGNYLTETQGPAFNSPFYSRISDFRLERQVRAIQARIR